MNKNPLLSALAACLFGLALFAPSASAVSSRAPEPFSPIDGSGTAVTVQDPQGLTIDQATGNLFVADRAAPGVVHVFGPTGGLPAGVAAPYQIGGFLFNNGSGPTSPLGLAFDNAVASPNQGALYVADKDHKIVKKLLRNPATELYELATEMNSTPPISGEPVSAALDQQGNLFIGTRVGIGVPRLVKFSPAGAQLATINTEKSLGTQPGSLAFDAAGNLFATGGSDVTAVVKFPLGPGGEFDPNTFTEVFPEDRIAGVATDPTTDALFVARPGYVEEYDAATLEKRREFGRGTLDPASRPRIAVNPLSDRVYVTDYVRHVVDVFGPPLTLPGVAAAPAEPVSATGATLNGSVNPDGLEVAECSFEYGVKPPLDAVKFNSSVPCAEVLPTDSSDHSVSAALAGLAPGTEYAFRLRAANANGPSYSLPRTFKTVAPAITGAATGVSGTRATLNGTVAPGGAPVTECRFDYGTTTAYGQSVPCAEAIPADDGEHAVSAALTHLLPNGAEYHFRIVTVGGTGTTNGADKEFTTEDTVITAPATDVEPETATLNGTLTPEGIPFTECLFEYGETAAYGQSVPCAQSPAQIGSGESPVAVHAALGGLAMGTTYHFRLVGINEDGTASGKDESFKTLGKPLIVSAWAEQVGLREASLRARVNPEGRASSYRVEWGTDTSYGNVTTPRQIGSDRSPHTVGVLLDGLAPGTTYHYRFLAESELGETTGPDRSFATFPAPADPAPCPNDDLRGGPSASLPDCRAYEMVSPLDKNGGDIQGLKAYLGTVVWAAAYRQAAADGERVTYSSGAAFGDAPAAHFSNQYISSRGPQGWSTHGISPPSGTALWEGQALPGGQWLIDTMFEGFSEDLCSAWVRDLNETPLAPGALVGYANLYRRGNCGAGGFEALTNQGPFGPTTIFLNSSQTDDGGTAPGLRLQGFSEDLSHQVFSSTAALTPDTPINKKAHLYDYHEGQLELLSVLPGGEPSTDQATAGRLVSTYHNKWASLERAVSSDGERVFWTAAKKEPPAAGPIYVRIGGAQTLEVSAEAESLEGTDGALYRTAARDGSAALFATGGALYRFDVDAALAEEPATSLLADRLVGLAGASEDLSRIYLVSRADLGDGGVEGEPNLYLLQGGTARLIATLPEDDVAGVDSSLLSPVEERPGWRVSRVTPEGGQLAFQSFGSLTGFDNTDPLSGKAYSEVFRYDAEADRLDCVSCNPTRVRPQGGALRDLYPYGVGSVLEGAVGGKYEELGAAAELPTWERELYPSRLLSDDGQRLYFHSYEALVAADTNGARDVYQWEAVGKGSCEQGSPSWVSDNGGCISLISTGTSPQRSEFVDASADGEDVFIATSSALDPRDQGLIDIYDVRVGGGFREPRPRAACEGEACQSPPAPPQGPTPSSSTYQGAGNVAGEAASRCVRLARRAGRLVRRGKLLRRAARHRETPVGRRAARRRAARTAKRAKRVSRSARRCRAARKQASTSQRSGR